MSATIQLGGFADSATIGDDLRVDCADESLREFCEIEARAVAATLGADQPDRVGAVADSLISRFGGQIVAIEAPAYFDDPPGLIY
jgi:hypothetical protein